MKRTTQLLFFTFFFLTTINGICQSKSQLLEKYQSQKDAEKINFCKNLGVGTLEEIWPNVKLDLLRIKEKLERTLSAGN